MDEPVFVPNPERAIVPEEKIMGYLLSQTHLVGRTKAAFFLGLGFSALRPDEFAQALKSGHLHLPALVKVTEWGTKYEITGEIGTPEGRMASVTSVWIVKSGEDFARLVTAYPGKR